MSENLFGGEKFDKKKGVAEKVDEEENERSFSLFFHISDSSSFLIPLSCVFVCMLGSQSGEMGVVGGSEKKFYYFFSST